MPRGLPLASLASTMTECIAPQSPRVRCSPFAWQSVPLVSSSGRLGSRYYVYHEQWVKKQRAGLAVNLAAFDVRVDPQQLQGYMDQIEATGKKVLIEQAVRSTFTPARALPTWDVTFRAIETSTVESSTPAPAPPAPPAEEWAGAALPWEVS